METMSLESVEKLRNVKCEGIPCSVYRKLADEIEREIADKYMLLPVDRKGEPWRIGDKFSFADASGKQHICTVSGLSGNEVFFYYDTHQDSTKHRHFKADALSHYVKHDPVKELLEELAIAVRDSQLTDVAIAALTEEIYIRMRVEIDARIREVVSAE